MLQTRQNGCHPEPRSVATRAKDLVFAFRIRLAESQPQGPSLRRKKRACVQDDSALGGTDVD
jgi:hypothetical protein